jgi:peptidoglycan/LPS O-acetylase OafA/YrhL
MIWMCITGNAGFINDFLSWKAFIPLSRLTYSVYLTHVWIDWYYWGTKRDLIDMNNFTYLFLFCGFVLMSYILGAIFSLLFESPFFVLHNYLKKYFLSVQNNNSVSKFHNNESEREIEDI